MDESTKKELIKLQAICARKEYCSTDIRKKAFERTTGDAQAAEEIVASLIEDKFVDDSRYAKAFARDKSALSGWGPIKIRYALSLKKIDSDIITKALGEISSSEALAKLEKVLDAKARSLSGDPNIRLKLIKFALSRGYEYSAVSSLLNKYTK